MLIVWYVVVDTFVAVEWEWQWLYHVLVKDVVMQCSTAMLAVTSVESPAISLAVVTTTKVLDVTGWFQAHVAGDHNSITYS